jgi:hypothetical protein
MGIEGQIRFCQILRHHPDLAGSVTNTEGIGGNALPSLYRSTSTRERPERTAQDYRQLRCGKCGKQFSERSADVLNKAQYPSDIIALVVLWRLRYKLSLRGLAEMFLTRGFIFTYEAVWEWEAKLTPALEDLHRKRRGSVGRSWYVA